MVPSPERVIPANEVSGPGINPGIPESTCGTTPGGEPTGSTNPLANQFYAADLGKHPTELTSALQAITGQISTCLFPLSPPPPVRSFQVPDTMDVPRTRVNVTSPAPRLSW